MARERRVASSYYAEFPKRGLFAEKGCKLRLVCFMHARQVSACLPPSLPSPISLFLSGRSISVCISVSVTHTHTHTFKEVNILQMKGFTVNYRFAISLEKWRVRVILPPQLALVHGVCLCIVPSQPVCLTTWIRYLNLWPFVLKCTW